MGWVASPCWMVYRMAHRPFLLGEGRITEHLCTKLGIKPGETTADGRFTLSLVECLGSCGTAPMFQINFDYHENLTPEKVDQILNALP